MKLILQSIKASDTMIHTYQKHHKLPFINNIYCVFFKGCAAVCITYPVIGSVAAVAIAAGTTIAVFTATARIKPLEKEYKVGFGKLDDFNKGMNEIQMVFAAVQEQVHQRGKMMSNISEATNEAKIYANYPDAQFVPNFDDLKHALIKLQDFCKDYLSAN